MSKSVSWDRTRSFFNTLNDGGEALGRFAKLGKNISIAGNVIATMNGSPSQASWNSSVSYLGTIEGGISFLRLPGILAKFITGDALYERKQERVSENTYRETKTLKDWKEIALYISLAVGRIFVCVGRVLKFLIVRPEADVKALIKHQKWVNIVTLAAFTSVQTFSFARSIEKLLTEEVTSKKIMDGVCNVLDTLAMPWDSEIITTGPLAGPYVSLAGAAICSLSAGATILNDWLF